MQKHDFVKGYSFFGHPVYSPFAALLGDAEDPLSGFLEARLSETLSTFGSTFEVIKAEGKVVLAEESAQRLVDSRSFGFQRRYILERMEDTLRERLDVLLFGAGTDAQAVPSGPVVEALGLRGTGTQGDYPVAERRRAGLRLRSERIARQVHTMLDCVVTSWRDSGQIALLDVGCGDGMVANELTARLKSVGLEVLPVLVEVKNYLAPEVERVVNAGSIAFVKLPPDYEQLALYQRSSAVVKDQAFDVILLLTVLHHTQLPSRVFHACVEVAAPNAVIVVIESCVGIDEGDLDEVEVRYPIQSIPSGDPTRKAFARLGLDEQLRYAAFIDWFYNRVIQAKKDIYVPCNFGTPGEWSEFFGEFTDCEVSQPLHIGFDQPLVPEYHTIHVVRKRELP